MPNEKEKLLEIGLEDLGRFSIGENSNALYLDDLKLQDALARFNYEKRLKREIKEIVHEVVDPRFDKIDSLLKTILERLTATAREASGTKRAKRKR
jgi:hypothetical protein